jgi:hypothetical protein
LQFNKYKNIKAFLLVAFGLWIALFFIRLLMPSEYAVIIIARSMVTDVLFGSDDARTTMLDFFENTGSPILLTLNTYISVSRLLIPLELLLIGFNIQYFIFLFYQIIVTSFLYKAFINFKKLYLSNTQKAAFIIYAGFLIGSALFEPGFGSWIRHQSAAQPVLFTLIWSTNDLEIKERNKMRVSAYLKNA